MTHPRPPDPLLEDATGHQSAQAEGDQGKGLMYSQEQKHPNYGECHCPRHLYCLPHGPPRGASPGEPWPHAHQDEQGKDQRAVDRVEWEQEKFVPISEDDFNCYVRDEWNWRERFRDTSRAITG